MTTAEVLILIGGGVLAGIAGVGAGIASLVSYPVLLATGLSPLVANVTNSVALTLSTAGAIAGSRPELRGQGERVRRYALLAVAGGAVGAVLLLTTPEQIFGYLVPWLIGVAAIALLARPWLQRMHADRLSSGHPAVAAGVAIAAVYSGYFGAGAGILVLALLAAVISDTMPRLNALKNTIVGTSNTVAAIGFAVLGPVDWRSVLPLAAGCFLGGLVAPWIVRRIPDTPLRIVIGLVGLGLAVKLGVDAY
ncbi:MAG: sulfite exporter TauE/SafE family protein [Actinomycetota bacterium]|nr:sulfite exporter TauE/SafE family protein [Geodermatophilaceae bacterium]MDQ3504242.1 sulfite exporter TauE/SafE family protein [Actinomycetota bacterium]